MQGKEISEGYWNGLHYCFLDGRSDIGILLSHPISLSVSWISEVAALFAGQGFKVWVLDLPGHGKSRQGRAVLPFLSIVPGIGALSLIPGIGKFFWAADFNLAETASMVLAFGRWIKRTAGLKYLIGGGLSFGGMVKGITLGLDKFHVFDLAFLQCFVSRREDVRAYENIPLMLALTGLFGLILGAAPVILFVKTSMPFKQQLIDVRFFMREFWWAFRHWFMDPETVLMFSMRTLLSLHFAKDFPESDIPVLLLAPENDGISMGHISETAQRLRQAEILDIPGAGHSVFIDGNQDHLKPGIIEEITAWIRKRVPD